MTNTDNQIVKIFNELLGTTEQQGLPGGVDILSYKSRIEYGCKLLGYSTSQRCAP